MRPIYCSQMTVLLFLTLIGLTHGFPIRWEENGALSLIDGNGRVLDRDKCVLVDTSFLLNEFQLLKGRVEELSDKVDHFVFTFADHTFRNNPSLHYWKEVWDFVEREPMLREMVQKKRLHLFLFNSKLRKDAWLNENELREAAIRNAFQVASTSPASVENMLLLLGDGDEILSVPGVQMLEKFVLDGETKWPVYLLTSIFYYNFQTYMGPWTKSVAHYLKRQPDGGFEDEQFIKDYADRLEQRSPALVINQNIPFGWHMSYFMSIEKMHEKIRSFPHAELDTEEIHAGLEDAVKNGRAYQHPNYTAIPKPDFVYFPTSPTLRQLGGLD